jgi:hypothetical protein
VKARPPLALLALLPACVRGGELRRITLSEDLSPGDVAYFREKAGSTGDSKIEDVAVGIPFLFLPLVSRSRETHANSVGEGRLHYHVEDDRGLGMFVLRASATANFDEEGRNLTYRRSVSLPFGVLSSATGHARAADGSAVPTSAFSLLWGFFSTERTPFGRSWTIFWFPIVSAAG